ncbi:diacylglycerol O-acyltransferase 1-like [Salvelinus namaycush]|uniref:diacylglycerol O-acyltransferase n=1 Tax=Salvelinus namaycush TaxID=8040 RepID=A0A8U1FA30_SALNM|nr:diacylglycerol O-acyltransferase 1-like [Salvelinus namaycush]
MSAAEPEACACSSSSLDVEEKCQYYGNSSSDPPTEPHPDMDMFCCHSVQDSLLSSDSRFTNYRGILNWIIILLILTHAHLFLDNFIQHGFLIDLRKVLEHLMEDNYNWPSVNLILAANMFAIAALLLERCLDKEQTNLYYFLLAPTLCYQRDFPFTPRVRINVLCKTLIEMWIEPIFQRSENSFSNMDITTRVEHLMELVYVIALPLHSCRLWIFFMMIFELLVDVYLGDYFKGNYGNGLVWLCFLLGPPLAVMTYFHDHYMSHHGQHPPGLSVAECLS